MLRNAHKQFEEIARLSNALSDQVKISALNTDIPAISPTSSPRI